jgi:hypothetical protein
MVCVGENQLDAVYCAGVQRLWHASHWTLNQLQLRPLDAEPAAATAIGLRPLDTEPAAATAIGLRPLDTEPAAATAIGR